MASLRQRKPLVSAADADSAKPIIKQFRKLDLYPKTSQEASKKSFLGGAVSLIGIGFILFLILHETVVYLSGAEAYSDELGVDVGIGDLVPVNLDVTFPNLQCGDVHLDVMDSSGDQQDDVDTDLYKNPVMADGELAFKGHFNYVMRRFDDDGKAIPYDPKKDPASPEFCGKCYIKPSDEKAAELGEREGGVVDHHLTVHHGKECCNSCEEVMEIYRRHNLKLPAKRDVEQCLHEIFQDNPGCHINGTIYVQKVKGNFHLAPGHTITNPILQALSGGGHIHAYTPESVRRFNTSHTINHLSFGDNSVKRIARGGAEAVFPLNGHTFTVNRTTLAMVKYFLKVVPATYQTGSASETKHAYEYAVTWHHKESTLGPKSRTTPGIFFVFDFHPIKIKHKFQRPPFGQFMLKVVCLVGGLVVVTGMLNQIVHWMLTVKKHFMPSGNHRVT